MRIVVASLNFPNIPRTLSLLLPEDEVYPCSEANLEEEIRQADVLVPTMARVGAEILGGSGLKLIHQWGVGLEGVDIDSATARGIAVCNVPAEAAPANAESTAEHALFLMMAAARQFHLTQRALRQGPWGVPEGQALFGRKALIVGLGRVGSALARRLIALGMEVMGIKAHPDKDSSGRPETMTVYGPDAFREKLGEADFVVSTLPVNEQTRGLYDRNAFSAMKCGAVFVNVGRGGVVVENDLLASLDDDHLSGPDWMFLPWNPWIAGIDSSGMKKL